MPDGRGFQVTILSIFVCIIMVVGALVMPSVEGEEDREEWTWEMELEFPELCIGGASGNEIQMENLPLGGAEGEPLLPFQSVMVPLPTGHEVTDVRILLDSLEARASVDTITLNAEAPLSDDVLALPSPMESYPSDQVRLEGVHVLDGESYAIVNVFPVTIDLITGEVSAATSAMLRVFTSPTGEEMSSPEEGKGGVQTSDVEYLIITSSDLEPVFQVLLDWKTTRGDNSTELASITGELITVEEIASDPSYWGDPSAHSGTGNDTQTQIRNLIIDYHQNRGTEYVLLAGDVEEVPCRKVSVIASLSGDIPADAYYAGLDGSWDADDDGVYGEGASTGGGSDGEEADLLLEVSVGRATVDSYMEASNFVDKVIAYEMTRNDPYLNTSLLVGERLDSRPTYGGDYKDEVYSLTFPSGEPEIDVTTLYERDGTFSRTAFIDAMNAGVHLINHMGHGDYDSFAELDKNVPSSLTNDQYFIMFSQACLIGGFDQQNEDSIAEEFISCENGAVAMVVNSRQGWYSPGDTDGSSQKYDIEFFDALFNEGITCLGDTLLDAKADLISEVWSTGSMRWCFMALNLLGDPETSVHFQVEREHDIAVIETQCDPALIGEESAVTVTLANLGEHGEQNVTVELIVDGLNISSGSVDVGLGETVETELTWIPDELGVEQLQVMVHIPEDDQPLNDLLDLEVEVGWRISGEEIISNSSVELKTFIIVDEGATLILENSTVWINGSDPLACMGAVEITDSLLVMGSGGPRLMGENSTLRVVNSTIGSVVQTSLTMEGGLEVSGSSFENLGIETINGTAIINNSTITGAETGFGANGSEVTLSCLEVGNASTGIHLVDTNGSTSDLNISGCGTGILMERCHGLSLDCSMVRECDMGLVVDSCTELTIINNTMVENTRDISFNGTEIAHFDLEVEGNEVSRGDVVYIVGSIDLDIGPDPDPGYLALVSCTNCSLNGLDLGGNGEGLLIVDCNDLIVEECRFNDSTVGVRALGCQDSLLIGNDFMSNQADLLSDGSVALNGTYLEGGNYWSRYNGTDDLSGSQQDQSGSDGLGDIPYSPPGSEVVDSYPLMVPATQENDPPEAEFTYHPTTPVTGQSISFQDLSRDLDGEILIWSWDFGDGTFESEQEPYHVYYEADNYTVTLQVMDDARDWDSFSVIITVASQEPTADFSFSPSFPDVGETVDFRDLSWDADGDISAWEWSFGDGNTSTLANPDHAYALKGRYIVTLTVWDDNELSDSRSKAVVVGNDAPVSDFDLSTSEASTGEEIGFNDRSYDPDGIISYRIWDFGDGTASSQADPIHVYQDDGVYEVTLTVTDDSGESDSSSVLVQISNRGPEASFIVSLDELGPGIPIWFNDTSTDPDGEIVSWWWDLGDGNHSSERNVIHSYALKGSYNVTLTVQDDDGEPNVAMATITVTSIVPETNFTFTPEEVYSLESISFSDASTDPDGEIVSWAWDFGDGTTNNASSPVHSYSTPGNYEVTLTVTDDDGMDSSLTRTVSVLNLAPVPDFTWSIDPLDPLTLQLESTSYDPDGEEVTHHWHFGDAGISTEVDPVHTYLAGGNYTVSLIVIDSEGNSSLVQKNVWIMITDLSLEILLPDNMTSGQPVTLEITVSNDGDLGVEGATVSLIVDGIQQNSSTISLGAGDSQTIQMVWSPTEGNHTLTIEVESCVGETNMDNNIYSIGVTTESEGPVPDGDDPDLMLYAIAILVVVVVMAVVVVYRNRSR